MCSSELAQGFKLHTLTLTLSSPQGASKSLVQLVTDLGNELKGSSEGKIVSIMEDFEHQIDGLGIKARANLTEGQFRSPACGRFPVVSYHFGDTGR